MPPGLQRNRSSTRNRITTRRVRRRNEVLSFLSSERGIAMAAWEHKYGWNNDVYWRYRKDVRAKATSYEGSDKDCADLSMLLLIDFAARLKLCLTFTDAKGGRYISKAKGLIQPTAKGGWELDDGHRWNSKEEFVKTVLGRTSAWDLAYHNSRVSQFGPVAGDLMLRAKKGWVGLFSYPESHAALVFQTYGPGHRADPEYKDVKGYPNYPGGDAAMKAVNQTRYFRGDVDAKGVTIAREPKSPFDQDVHFNYLNSRGDGKRNAELIYFANERQIRADGFNFYEYSLLVTDNWPDFNGDGVPPFRTHKYREQR